MIFDQSRHTFTHSDGLRCVDLDHSQKWSEHICIEKRKCKKTGDTIHMTLELLVAESSLYNCQSRWNDSKRLVMFPRVFRCCYGARNEAEHSSGSQLFLSFFISVWARPDRYQRSFLLHSYPDTADPSFSLTKLIILSWRVCVRSGKPSAGLTAERHAFQKMNSPSLTPILLLVFTVHFWWVEPSCRFRHTNVSAKTSYPCRGK